MDADHLTAGNHAAVAPIPTSVLDKDHPAAPARTYSNDSTAEAEEKYDDEKRQTHVENVVVSDLPEIYDVLSGDPIPETEGLPEETHQLTARALLIGAMLGGIVQASNIYLGLKTGFTFGPSLFGAIFGFAIIKPLSRILPRYLGGGYFGPKENVTVQTAATAAGGLGIIFVSGVPAMYQLNLLGSSPKSDIGRLFALTAVGAFYGMCFAIPMRKWYILKQKLVFPTPMATAFTIHAMHSGPAGAVVAAKKAWCLALSFFGAMILRVTSGYVPGILYNFNPAWYFYTWGWQPGVIGASNWGWLLQFTPAFFGAGILSGINASYSFFGGAVLAWGIIGPSLVATGRAVGRQLYPDYPDVKNYYSMAPADPRSNRVSPRYWLLWPGVLIMLGASFAEVGVNWRALANGMKILYRSTHNTVQVRRGKDAKYEIDTEDSDKTPQKDRVPMWLWSGGLVASVVFTCIVMALCFDMNVGYSILAIILGFLFSVIGVQSAGATDVNPISTVAKASQLVFGGVTRGKYSDQDVVSPAGIRSNPGAERVNLLAGLVSAMAAAQTVDMTGDLKTGHLIGAKPIIQFIAQAFGAVVSIFLAPGLYVLFVQAYPCINDINAERCTFGAPSVGAWRAVAVAVTGDGLPLPTSSGVVGLVLMGVAIASVIARETIVPHKYRVYVPNWNAVGLAFVLNSTVYNSAMLWGSTAGYFWKKKSPKTFDIYAYALAAGLIAGEGIAGVVTALLTVVDKDGSKYGTSVGCAANDYCG